MQLEIHELDRRYAALRIEDPTRRAQLAASIARHGQQGPVLVVRHDDRYVLVDGYVRVAALLELGRDLVEAVVLDDVDEAGALILRHRLSTRRTTALEDGWLLCELIETYQRSQEALAVELQRSASWVSRRLALVQILPTTVQEAVRDGRVPPYAAMKFLVPLARAKVRDCASLVDALSPDRVTSRQVERLYLAWRRADPEGRARIVADPKLFLKVDAEVAAPAESPPDETAALIDDLEAVSGMCRRARKRLRTGVLDRISGPERDGVASAWRETREAVGSLLTRMQAEVFDARPGDPGGDPAAGPPGTQPAPDRARPGRVPQHGPGGADERVGGGAADRPRVPADEAPGAGPPASPDVQGEPGPGR